MEVIKYGNKKCIVKADHDGVLYELSYRYRNDIIEFKLVDTTFDIGYKQGIKIESFVYTFDLVSLEDIESIVKYSSKERLFLKKRFDYDSFELLLDNGRSSVLIVLDRELSIEERNSIEKLNSLYHQLDLLYIDQKTIEDDLYSNIEEAIKDIQSDLKGILNRQGNKALTDRNTQK